MRPIVSAIVSAMLVTFSTHATEPEAQNVDPQPQAMDFGSEPCHTTFTSGSGATFIKVCISPTGNIQQFESPQGFEHIAVGDSVVEGYALCDEGFDPEDPFDNSASYDGGSAAASGGGAFNSQNAHIHQPNGPNTFPLTITREGSALSGLELRQDFSRRTADKELSITMRVTNRDEGRRTVHGVTLSRFFDGDLDNQWWDNLAGHTADAAWIWRQHGLMLTALTFERPHVASAQGWPWRYSLGWPEYFCGESGSDEAGARGDWVGVVGYRLGSIAPGRSKTVKFGYRRF